MKATVPPGVRIGDRMDFLLKDGRVVTATYARTPGDPEGSRLVTTSEFALQDVTECRHSRPGEYAGIWSGPT